MAYLSLLFQFAFPEIALARKVDCSALSVTTGGRNPGLHSASINIYKRETPVTTGQGWEFQLCSDLHWDFPSSEAGKASACNVGDLGSVPGLGRSSCRRERLASPVFWPGEFHGLYSQWGHKELDMTEQFAMSLMNDIMTFVFLCQTYFTYYDNL